MSRRDYGLVLALVLWLGVVGFWCLQRYQEHVVMWAVVQNLVRQQPPPTVKP